MVLVGWVETTEVGDDWADAPVDEAVLSRYLSAAHVQCVEFLPHRRVVVRDPVTSEVTSDTLEPVIPNPVPATLVLAQIMQARALWNATQAGSGDQLGPDGMTVRVFPMDWTVKNLLRPKTLGRFA